jgi:MYXO-CTERM domain-containing protein
MKYVSKIIACALSVSCLVVFEPAPAEACGGCFVPPDENTLVTGHRMVLSVSSTQTTLYDQIEYVGDPASFAWVLPIAGLAEIGLLPDMYINQLGLDTTVRIARPPLNCPSYNCPSDGESLGASTGTSGSGGGNSQDGGVDVIAQEVVGPYETVQLAAEDPDALNTWLIDHGYQIPTDVQPVIAQYVKDGSNFLAMKLVPGQGVDKMQPVSITTPGGNPQLPLKMVAAGTGATTLMTLYVIAEGRYEPSNFPSFTIPENALVWDWDTASSNYTKLRQSAYEASNGHAWLVESSVPYSESGYRNRIHNILDFNGPEASGYPELSYEEAQLAADEDLNRLFAGMDPTKVTVTRLRGELSRGALSTDLVLGASDDQAAVPTSMQASLSIGTKPLCPPKPDGCDDDGQSAGGWGLGSPGSNTGSASQSSCAYRAVSATPTGSEPWLAFASLLGLGVIAAGRRQRRR